MMNLPNLSIKDPVINHNKPKCLGSYNNKACKASEMRIIKIIKFQASQYNKITNSLTYKM